LADDDSQERAEPESEPPPSGPRFLTAMAYYTAIAVLAWFTLDGKIRLVVWIFMAGLAARTYLHTLRKP
jgi:hypothetical protein